MGESKGKKIKELKRINNRKLSCIRMLFKIKLTGVEISLEISFIKVRDTLTFMKV